MDKMHPHTRVPWSRTVLLAVAVTSAASLAGCASQVDLSSIRREQRMLSRKLADQRADIDRLSSEVSRMRGYSSGDARYGSTAGQGQDPYSQGTGYGAAPGTHPGTHPGAQAGGQTPPGTMPGAGAGGRDYGSGTDYGTAPSQPGAAPGGGPAAGVPPTPTGPSGGSNLQNDMGRGNDGEYQEGLQSYARGDYQRSVQSLRNYVSRNPRDPLVPVAQYWIGEAYFSQGKYNESILAFNEILVTWPNSDRKPSALLRQADAFARTGDKIDARMILQKLIEDHPGTQEAAEAKEQLRALGG